MHVNITTDKGDNRHDFVGASSHQNVLGLSNLASCFSQLNHRIYPMSATCSIVSFRTSMDENGKEFTVFGIEVNFAGQSWTLEKRYSEFWAFNHTVSDLSRGLSFPFLHCHSSFSAKHEEGLSSIYLYHSAFWDKQACTTNSLARRSAHCLELRRRSESSS